MIDGVRQGRPRHAPGASTPDCSTSYDFETRRRRPESRSPPRRCCGCSGLQVGHCRPPMGPAPDGRRTLGADRAREPVLEGPGLMAAAPVKITFLGGLGEIGRNCAAIELDGQIMLIDCGLMFPDTDMLGRRPRPARLHLPARERRPHRRAASPPTATRTTSAACRSCCASCRFPIFGSALTLGLARDRIEEAGLLEPHRVHRGRRRRAHRGSGPSTCEFIPVTHSVPHGVATAFHTAAGHDPAHRRLQDRPHPGRRPPHRPRPHRRDRRRRGHPPAAGRLHQRRRARATPARRPPSARSSTTSCTSTRVGASSSPASPATSTGSSRSPTRPSPSTARSPPLGRSMKKQHVAWPARWACYASPTRRSSTSRTSTTSSRGRSA